LDGVIYPYDMSHSQEHFTENFLPGTRRLRLFACGLLFSFLLVAITRATAADPPPVSKTPPLFTEDFESTPVGAIPDGFSGDTNKVAVRDDFAATGKKSLRVEAAPRGPRRITLQGDILTKLGGQFWGRLYYRVQTPYPLPDPNSGNPVIHSTFVAGSALSPQFHDQIEVRMLDTVMNKQGAHQYIYNVQPKSRGEFGKGSAYLYHYTNEWTLAEWSVDYATQSYHLYINGQEITGVALDKGAGNFTKVELPEVFTSLSFGLYNYQSAGTGLVIWIDDIALGKERIGPRAPAGL
jgi:hypothetical protein